MSKPIGSKIVHGREPIGSNRAGTTRALIRAIESTGASVDLVSPQAIEIWFSQTDETFRIFTDGRRVPLTVARVRGA